MGMEFIRQSLIFQHFFAVSFVLCSSLWIPILDTCSSFIKSRHVLSNQLHGQFSLCLSLSLLQVFLATKIHLTWIFCFTLEPEINLLSVDLPEFQNLGKLFEMCYDFILQFSESLHWLEWNLKNFKIILKCVDMIF